MKQAIIIRDDVDISRGKAVAQGCHVSVLATLDADSDLVDEWLENGGKKITLKVGSEKELLDLIDSVEDIPNAKVRDLGYTEIDPNTLTAGAVGPATDEKVDQYTGDLDLY